MKQEHKNKETILKNINNFNIFFIIFNRQLGMSEDWYQFSMEWSYFRLLVVQNRKNIESQR